MTAAAQASPLYALSTAQCPNAPGILTSGCENRQRRHRKSMCSWPAGPRIGNAVSAAITRCDGTHSGPAGHSMSTSVRANGRLSSSSHTARTPPRSSLLAPTTRFELPAEATSGPTGVSAGESTEAPHFSSPLPPAVATAVAATARAAMFKRSSSRLATGEGAARAPPRVSALSEVCSFTQNLNAASSSRGSSSMGSCRQTSIDARQNSYSFTSNYYSNGSASSALPDYQSHQASNWRSSLRRFSNMRHGLKRLFRMSQSPPPSTSRARRGSCPCHSVSGRLDVKAYRSVSLPPNSNGLKPTINHPSGLQRSSVKRFASMLWTRAFGGSSEHVGATVHQAGEVVGLPTHASVQGHSTRIRTTLPSRFEFRASQVENTEMLISSINATERARLPWGFVGPESVGRAIWDVLSCACMSLQVCFLPFHEAFVQVDDIDLPLVAAAAWFMLLIDLFWVADILRNLTTSYYDDRHELQRDPGLIMLRYVRSWLAVDVLATIPRLAALAVAGTWDQEVIRIFLPLMRSSFLVRLMKLRKYARDLGRVVERTQSQFVTYAATIVKLVLLPLVTSHLAACALWAVGRQNLGRDPDATSWIRKGLALPDGSDLVGSSADIVLFGIPLSTRYVCALYFTVTVMSTVGLGDISADLEDERLLLMVVMILTSVVISVAVSFLSQLIAKMQESSSEMNEHLFKASAYMTFYKVEKDLQERVTAYLKQLFENKDREDMKTRLMGWIRRSDLLHAELNFALTGRCLATHPMLARVSREGLVEICNLCVVVFEPPGAVLQAPGTEVTRCIYIRSGCVHVRECGRVGSLRRPMAAAMPSSATTAFAESVPKNRSVLVNRWRSAAIATVAAGRLSTMGGSGPTPAKTSVVPSIGGVASGGGKAGRLPSQGQDGAIGEARAESNELDWLYEVERVDRMAAEKGRFLESGQFLNDNRLFFGSAKTRHTAKCVAFSELISLDVMAFHSRMLEMDARLFQNLSIYFAIEHDCAEFLKLTLQKFDVPPDRQLFNGEIPLHACAKNSAARCAAMLVEMRANVEALDVDGVTPIRYAAEAGNGEIFLMLVLRGARSTDEVLAPCSTSLLALSEPALAKQLSDGLRVTRTGSPISVRTFVRDVTRCDSKSTDESIGVVLSHATSGVEELTSFLEDRGLDPLRWGQPLPTSCVSDSPSDRAFVRVPSAPAAPTEVAAKASLQTSFTPFRTEDLLLELKTGMCTLNRPWTGRPLLRQVAVLRLRLLAKIDFRQYVLAEVESDTWLAAEDPFVATLPGKKIRNGEQRQTLLELTRRIGLDTESDLPYLNLIEVLSYEETKPSMSYPGLETHYFYTEVVMSIRNGAVAKLTNLGLPTGSAVQHRGAGGRGDARRSRDRTYFWAIATRDYDEDAFEDDNVQSRT
eukprot:TRINITY_DN48351_c0_g1_i1.p1 TRINITY_DN48351_c0_g1~~TRINITY_DN48351_c0_g1_i1.p1  ORF type:complete len:1470 (+),score=249.07 TRINITY_DN48351_c0_g1_i1:233-4411(+)